MQGNFDPCLGHVRFQGQVQVLVGWVENLCVPEIYFFFRAEFPGEGPFLAIIEIVTLAVGLFILVSTVESEHGCLFGWLVVRVAYLELEGGLTLE